MPAVEILNPFKEWWVQVLDETFTRSQIAAYYGVSRTIIWASEKEVIKPAVIRDYNQYVREHPKKLDLYCFFVIDGARGLVRTEGTYEKAAEQMRKHRVYYSRQAFEALVNHRRNKNGEKRISQPLQAS